ncbi:MAG: hypothetical protein EON54_04985 [Alcaligenaceae bacterium]|nr:MAG: hypothetical protein EON54_04985 [Alcaligenaceae bacterium]
MRILITTALLSFVALAGCSTYTPQRYTISADNNMALKRLGASNINVGSIKGVAAFNQTCRVVVGPIAPPDNMTFEGYIQKALSDELKVAGMFDSISPKVTLTGQIERLEFSSSRGITGGTWDIELRVVSSNGRSTKISNRYQFESGFRDETACKQTAEAFLPAVQDLIGKLISAPEFKAMVSPQG